ncbi:hypothetical protein C1646_747275 [Rhizophagus diaphanus]|nr:hypothetical protein C1646_747275 [Rhizophagus diaphanus] [Rhizophagus sp. MUCL 43196]
MDATNFNNEKFEYMKDVSWVMSVASSAQSPQTKNYLAKKSGGIQKRAFVPTMSKPFKFYTESRANNSHNKENSPNPPFVPLALSVPDSMLSIPSPPHVIKANPVSDYKEPYRPVIEHRLIELPMFSLPEPIGFFFFTDTRMEERHIYDEHRRFREKEVEEQRIAKIREEEVRSAEEIRRLIIYSVN